MSTVTVDKMTGNPATSSITTSFTSTQTIGVTSTDGLLLTNTTAAAAGAQQWSPRVHWHGSGWKTNATAAAQDVDWIAELVPVQGAAAPTANFVMSYGVNGGAYTNLMTVNSVGQIGLQNGSQSLPAYSFTSDLTSGVYWDGSAVNVTVGGTRKFFFAAGGGGTFLGTDATSTSTGAWTVSGGASVGKNLYVGTAVNIAGPNGSQWIQGYATELLTLSTSGTTTDTTANLLPANSIIEAVVARVTTTITTATDWELGDATTPGRFSAPNATMASGTTQVGLVHVDQVGAAGPRQTSAAKVRVTTTGTPGAGAIRITVFYRQFVPPTS